MFRSFVTTYGEAWVNGVCPFALTVRECSRAQAIREACTNWVFSITWEITVNYEVITASLEPKMLTFCYCVTVWIIRICLHVNSWGRVLPKELIRPVISFLRYLADIRSFVPVRRSAAIVSCWDYNLCETCRCHNGGIKTCMRACLVECFFPELHSGPALSVGGSERKKGGKELENEKRERWKMTGKNEKKIRRGLGGKHGE
jgi:hypothetical protein